MLAMAAEWRRHVCGGSGQVLKTRSTKMCDGRESEPEKDYAEFLTEL